MNKLFKDGFAPIMIVPIVLLVGVVGVAGWMVYDNSKDEDVIPETTSNSSTVPATASVPIESSADIDAAVEELESVPVEEDLNTTDLDEDLDTVL